MSDKKFAVGCSPLTNRLYAGYVVKSGGFVKAKHDVTDSAVSAVAQHLIQLNQKVSFHYFGKNYEMRVIEVKDKE